MNLPNLLTLSRIGWAVVLIVLLEQSTLTGDILAVIIFILASLTDFYDGYLAKKLGQVSDFGKIMDPIADKVLLLSVFGVLAHINMVAWWMFGVIALRELVVTISRLMMMRQGRVLAAERAGKIKTVTQITAVLVLLLYLMVEELEPAWFYKVKSLWLEVNYGLMLAAVILTVYSGIEYFRHKSKI
jgi:CDP-diacylglycerol--glycerol-3-phosphate 3-phosphatidyltransferase